MSSRDGYARADIDTNLFHDPKTVALARRLRDHHRTADAMMLYEATVLASWKAGRRLTITEAAPAWWLDDPTEQLADMQAVGLLDDEGRVPEHAFTAWTARAAAASIAGTVAATARWHGRNGSSPTHADPIRPDATAVRPHATAVRTEYPDRLTDRQPDSLALARDGAEEAPPRETFRERAQRLLADPSSTEEVRAGARAMLERAILEEVGPTHEADDNPPRVTFRAADGAPSAAGVEGGS